jgi:hypothetical protein
MRLNTGLLETTYDFSDANKGAFETFGQVGQLEFILLSSMGR